MVRHRQYVTAPTREQGQALVEFSLVLPILVFFIFMALQVAIILGGYVSVIQLARHSARYVAVHPEMYDNEILSQAIEPNTPSNLDYNDFVTITIDTGVCDSGDSSTTPCADRTSGDPVTVALQYDAADLLFLPTTFFGFTIQTTLPNLSATMVVE
ncbi:MAG: TadE/TadG family type IV pilus assembly protein [Anaerolineae bacterium]